jgi:hypothetical protein
MSLVKLTSIDRLKVAYREKDLKNVTYLSICNYFIEQHNETSVSKIPLLHINSRPPTTHANVPLLPSQRKDYGFEDKESSSSSESESEDEAEEEEKYIEYNTDKLHEDIQNYLDAIHEGRIKEDPKFPIEKAIALLPEGWNPKKKQANQELHKMSENSESCQSTSLDCSTEACTTKDSTCMPPMAGLYTSAPPLSFFDSSEILREQRWTPYIDTQIQKYNAFYMLITGPPHSGKNHLLKDFLYSYCNHRFKRCYVFSSTYRTGEMDYLKILYQKVQYLDAYNGHVINSLLRAQQITIDTGYKAPKILIIFNDLGGVTAFKKDFTNVLTYGRHSHVSIIVISNGFQLGTDHNQRSLFDFIVIKRPNSHNERAYLSKRMLSETIDIEDISAQKPEKFWDSYITSFWRQFNNVLPHPEGGSSETEPKHKALVIDRTGDMSFREAIFTYISHNR